MENNISRYVLSLACLLTAVPVLAISNEEFSGAVEKQLNSIRRDAALRQGVQQLCANLRGQRFDEDMRCVAYDRLVMEIEGRERPNPLYPVLVTGAYVILLTAIPAVIVYRRKSEIVEKEDGEK